MDGRRVSVGPMNDVAATTATFVALLGVGTVIAIIAERFRIPAAVAFVAVGAFFPPFEQLTVPFAFGSTLLSVYLPPLIFESSWNVDLGALRRMIVPIGVLAVPGVLVSAFIVAFGVAGSGQLPFAAAFTLGAIVSATDPIAVIAIFRKLTVPLDLSTLIEGESTANDGFALVLFAVAVGFATQPESVNLWWQALHAVVAIVGGIAIGIACAVAIGFAIRGAREQPAELAGTIVLAYAAYLIANMFDLSGVFATAAAAITLRALNRYVLTAQSHEDVSRFWDVLAFVANAVVFLSTGLLLQFPRIAHEPLLVIVALVSVIVARLILSFVLLPLCGVRQAGWRTTSVFAGMRGALSLALALSLPERFHYRPQIIDATFAIVFVTIVVQGLSIEPVLRRLNLRG